jgi:hypothetical protein
MRWVLALIMLAGCGGSRCKEVNDARAALAHVGTPDRGADVRVVVPLERANTLIAELLRAEPLEAPIDVPDLGPIEVTTSLTAHVRDVKLQPGEADRVRFAVRLEIRDREREITTLAMVAEVAPQLQRGDDGARLMIGFGPRNLLDVQPELGPDAQRALGNAVARALPESVRERVPQVVIELAAGKLATHLTGGAYRALQATLLKRVGDLSKLQVRLPDVPVATWSIVSTERTMTIEIVTDLPVRRGLAPPATEPTELTVAMSGSAVAELANWAIDRGYAPRWYNRTIEPRDNGEFRPRFDYLAEDRAHPIKVYSFQERGGCSYFRIGVRAGIAMDGDQLKATAFDRELERRSANPVIEAAAWAKYFVIGSLNRSKRVAAHTQFKIGERTLETRVVDAAMANDEVRFALRVGAK